MKRLLPILAITIALAVAALVYFATRSTTPAPPPEGYVTRDLPSPTPPVPPTAPTGSALPRAAGRPLDPGAPPAEKVTRATGVRLVKGAWGSGPGQFGRKRDPESAPEMPMAILAGAVGEVSILDQVNRRVQRFKDGKALPALSFGSDTVQDLIAAPGGRTVLLDRLADKELQIYDANGKLTNEVPLAGKGVPEGGGVTGVFADDKGIYVERAHGPLVRIADSSGNADPERQELAGRPAKNGRLLLAAKIVRESGPGNLVVRAIDRKTGRPAWEQVVLLGAPILNILLLDSDAKGHIYLAASTGSESPEPPYAILDETIRAVRLTEEGAPRGLIEIPMVATADESFRTMAVDEGGNICLMVPRADGLEVMRYSFP